MGKRGMMAIVKLTLAAVASLLLLYIFTKIVCTSLPNFPCPV